MLLYRFLCLCLFVCVVYSLCFLCFCLFVCLFVCLCCLLPLLFVFLFVFVLFTPFAWEEKEHTQRRAAPCEVPCGAVWHCARRVKRRAAPCGATRAV